MEDRHCRVVAATIALDIGGNLLTDDEVAIARRIISNRPDDADTSLQAETGDEARRQLALKALAIATAPSCTLADLARLARIIAETPLN